MDLFEGLCPICGIALEPATALAELVGFRRFELVQDEPAFETSAHTRQRLLDRVAAVAATESTSSAANTLSPTP